jgi:formylmethanofuran dehydrogenase subunit C
MSCLQFTLKQAPQQRLDLSPLVCQHLINLSLDEINAIKLYCGKQQLSVAELFNIEGDDANNIVFINTSDKCDFIGKELNGGCITIEGDAGAYLGLGLLNGSITVKGNTGIYAGGEMRKGLITIEGNAGDFLGSALPGNKMGMKGGLILVKGNAGERVGDHLRRGTILIEGNAGDYCGSRMTAGTIAVMGSTGRFVGYAMRRGTLLLWQTPQLTASFNDCGSHTLGFLPLLFNSFKSLDSKFASVCFNRIQRYGGDMAEMGRGEILVKI